MHISSIKRFWEVHELDWSISTNCHSASGTSLSGWLCVSSYISYVRAEVNTISSWSLIWDQPASTPVRYIISCHARSYLIMSHKFLVVSGEVKTTDFYIIYMRIWCVRTVFLAEPKVESQLPALLKSQCLFVFLFEVTADICWLRLAQLDNDCANSANEDRC